MACSGDKMTVNRRSLPIKGAYFCVLAGLASMLPYIPVYLKRLGLTPSETSVTCGMTLLISGITRTFIGGWADKLKAHKSVMAILCLVSAVFFSVMLLVPQRPTSESHRTTIDVQLHCGMNDSLNIMLVCSEDAIADGRMEKITVINNTTFGGATHAVLNTSACNLQCGVQQNDTNRTGEICFIRSLRENCSALHRNRTYVFNLNELQSLPAQVCLAMTSVGEPACRCYAIRSFAMDDAVYERIVCGEETRFACSTACALDGGQGNATRGTYSGQRIGLHFGRTFVSVSVLYFLGMFAFQPVIGLIDAMAYTFLGDDHHKWGQQRLWGTIGYGSFALISGLLMDAYANGNNEYAVAFILFAGFMVLSAACACQFDVNVDSIDVVTSPNMFRDVVDLLRRPDACILFCLLIFFGMYQGLILTFLFWYLRLLGDVPQALFGMCISFNCIPEMFMLFFSGAILRRIGHVFAMSIAIVAFAVRLGSYSLLRNPWMVLAIEPLHAFTFGLMYAAASTYARRITPPGSHGAVQNTIGSLYHCIGQSMGSLLGGPLFERYGGALTFRMFGASAIVLLVTYLVCQKFCVQHTEREEVTTSETAKDRYRVDTGDALETRNMLAMKGGESHRNEDTTNNEDTTKNEDITIYEDRDCDDM